MSENIIHNDKDEVIGYYKDLRELIIENITTNVKDGYHEQAIDDCKNLIDLDRLKDYKDLIVLSENNGMGFTARKYKGEE